MRSRYLMAMFISESSSESDRLCGRKSEIDQLRMLGVVVMLLGLDARGVDVLDLDGHAEVPRGLLHHVGQLQHRKLLRELVEDAAFPAAGRAQTRELDAADRVANIQESAGLAAACRTP